MMQRGVINMSGKNIFINVLKWTARISGILVIALFLFMGVASIIFGEEFVPWTTAEILMGLCIPLLFGVGAIVGWKNEFKGAIIIFASVFLFNLIDFMMRESFEEFNIYFWQLAIIGIIYLIVYMYKKK
jgi:hypothetical protein